MSTPTSTEAANPYTSLPNGQTAEAEQMPGRRRGLVVPFPSTRKKPALPAPGERRGRAGRTGTDTSAAPGVFKAAPKSTRDVLGYKTMLPNGVAWLGADEWSMTMRVSDINYVAAAEEHQESIVDRWARFLNSFGAGTRVQETVTNRVLADADVADLVQKQLRGDEADKYRSDFNRIVRDKLASASGNTVTEKYVTVTVQEPDEEKANATLTRIAHEIEASLQSMDDCKAERLTRTERLAALAHVLRPHELFGFTEDGFAGKHRQATADYVAPWGVEVLDKAGPLQFHNGTADTFHQVLWVRDYPVWLSDRLITELTEIKCDLTVSLHLEPYDQIEGMTLIERQIAEMEMQTITERKKAKKQGIGEDMIPRKLVEALDEGRELRQELSTSNQKVFSTVMVIGVSAGSRAALEQNVKRAMTVIRKQSVKAEVLKWMQVDGLTTELPIGRRAIPMRRTLTTASAAIIVPFTTQELFVPGGIWYGVNAQSSNALVADRTATPNGNGFFFGTSGSGKSQFGKNEIAQIVLDRPDDDVIIIDPEREYEPVVAAFKGSTARIHAGSLDRVNPMDIDLDADTDDGDPILAKSNFVLAALDHLIGGQTGLNAQQRSLADRVTVALYRRYAAERGPMPTFLDLRDGLIATGDPVGAQMGAALELYTVGSLNTFSQQTNVDTNARLFSWDINQLGSELKSFGMMVVLDQVWQRIVRNRAIGRRTWVYVDEFHLLLVDRFLSEFFRTLWARVRKYGANATGITQNIEAVLAHEDARLMLANSDFLALLGQNPTDADALVELLHFSSEQRRRFTNVLPGQGLLRSGGRVIPFDGRIPEDSLLYRLFSTKFGETNG